MDRSVQEFIVSRQRWLKHNLMGIPILLALALLGPDPGFRRFLFSPLGALVFVVIFLVAYFRPLASAKPGYRLRIKADALELCNAVGTRIGLVPFAAIETIGISSETLELIAKATGNEDDVNIVVQLSRGAAVQWPGHGRRLFRSTLVVGNWFDADIWTVQRAMNDALQRWRASRLSS